MSISRNLNEDIEKWSNSTENPILTPAASETGGTWDGESGCCNPSTYQRPILNKEYDKGSAFNTAPPKPWNDTNPWPGNTYVITEKNTGRAITFQHGELVLEPDHGGTSPTAHNTWLCCEQNNYWGFLNPVTGHYLGHDGGGGMRAAATEIRGWEMFQARSLAGGGYLLLMPYYSEALQQIAVAEDARHLTRRMHGGAVWEFRRVQT